MLTCIGLDKMSSSRTLFATEREWREIVGGKEPNVIKDCILL